jgi:hypothetical protein
MDTCGAVLFRENHVVRIEKRSMLKLPIRTIESELIESEMINELQDGFEDLVDAKDERSHHEADYQRDHRCILKLVALWPADLAHFASDVIKKTNRLVLEAPFGSSRCDRCGLNCCLGHCL